MAEVLEREELNMLREKQDQIHRPKKQCENGGASLDTAERPQPVFTKDDFETALNNATRKIAEK